MQGAGARLYAKTAPLQTHPLRCAAPRPTLSLAPPRQPDNCFMPALAQLPKEQTPEHLYAALNIIKEPSMIRVEADEVR